MKLDTVTARARLEPRNEPYWVRLASGQHLGYRKGTKGAAWIAKWRDPANGQRHQTKLGDFAGTPPAQQFDVAKKAAEQWLQHVIKGGTPQVLTVDDACKRYADKVERERGAKATADIGRRLAQFITGQPIAKIELDKLKPQHVRHWREWLQDLPTVRGTQRSDSSLNRDMTVLRAALNLAFAEHSVMSDAAWRSTLKPIGGADKARTAYLDIHQRRALIDAAQPDLQPFLRVLCAIPLRPGALAAVTARDYNKRLKVLSIPQDKAGAGRKIQLPASTAAFFDAAAKGKLPGALLFHRSDGAPWIKDSYKHPFAKAAAAAGLSATAYTLRHSTIADLVSNGVDTMTVARIAGTSVLMIDRHYGHLTGAAAAAALDKLASM